MATTEARGALSVECIIELEGALMALKDILWLKL
jgi:hypothetical protein